MMLNVHQTDRRDDRHKSARFAYPISKKKGGGAMRFHNINIRNILSEALNYGGIIVDVRTSEEFAKSHIPMAINLPLEEIQAGNISLPKGKVILVYCANGGGSTLAAKILTEKGYKVINTIGGISGYRGALTKTGIK